VPYLYPVLAKGALLDLDHAETLKSPQGILFGQNATGGPSTSTWPIQPRALLQV
jgi:hypothetical protein